MKIEADRSRRIAFVVGIAVVAFAAGLALALWGPSVGQTIAKAAGALGIVAGLYLLTSRDVLERDDRVSPDLQRPSLHMARTRLRIVGATVILMGVAQWVPETAVRTGLLLCAAAVSILGVFKVPRRLFTTGDHEQ
jgi:hypothetical protein